jgi:hypothetical protein
MKHICSCFTISNLCWSAKAYLILKKLCMFANDLYLSLLFQYQDFQVKTARKSCLELATWSVEALKGPEETLKRLRRVWTLLGSQDADLGYNSGEYISVRTLIHIYTFHKNSLPSSKNIFRKSKFPSDLVVNLESFFVPGILIRNSEDLHIFPNASINIKQINNF